MICNPHVICNYKAARYSHLELTCCVAFLCKCAQPVLAKTILSSLLQNSNVENLPPHVLRLVYKEVSALAADPPEGIKVFPSEEDITELHTSIEGPGRRCRVMSYKASFFNFLWVFLQSKHQRTSLDFLNKVLPWCRFIQHKILPYVLFVSKIGAYN